MKSATVKKWQLTETGFNSLLVALSGDRELAGQKYLLLKRNLERFFETRGFRAIEDAADEVFNRLARKIELQEIENPESYALGIARMVALELRKSPQYKTSNELPEIRVMPIDAEAMEKDGRFQCLEECLMTLSADNRRLIVGYYQGEKREKIKNRNRLAESLGIANNALRNRAVRLRDKLENCIRSCLQKL